MDPITLASITTATTLLALEAGKGLAKGAGQDAWNKVKQLFGWAEPPAEAELAKAIATKLHEVPALAGPLRQILQASGDSTASVLAHSITAESVVVAQTIHATNFVMKGR